MAFDDLQLSLLAFPQRWDGARLAINALLLPVGDPLAPLLGGAPHFAGTTVHLTVKLLAGDALPTPAAAPLHSIGNIVAAPPPVAVDIYTNLKSSFAARGVAVTSAKLDGSAIPSSPPLIKKSLPESYTNAFAFERPRDPNLLEVGDGYCCAVRDQAPRYREPLPDPPKTIAWGQIISFALRQPKLAAAMGLVYGFEFPLDAANVADTTYIYFALDPAVAGNPWAAGAGTGAVKSYAARLPALDATHRPLFAATLFPVIAAPGAGLAQAQAEAAEYDDGFAQIVHSNQPSTIDAVTLQSDRIAPATEAGIQLGWDDEQHTVWLNNQVALLHTRANHEDTNADAPLGVQGQRVDVRVKGTGTWHSLCAIDGTLDFDDSHYGKPASTSLKGTELWLAPAPVRKSDDVGGVADNSGNATEAWLPLYFAQWAGTSLVLPDPVVAQLAAAAEVAKVGGPLPGTPGLPNPRPVMTGVPELRYGSDYEFRLRLVDMTGGGPWASEKPVHPGDAPVALARFRRYVPPKSLEVQAAPAVDPTAAPAARVIDTLTVRRPRIGYPEAVFAGVDRSRFTGASLTNLIADAAAAGGTLDIPDPDVDSFDVVVEARIPAHDTGTAGPDAGQLDGNYRIVYSVNIPFPGEAKSDEQVVVTLDYDGMDDIATVSAPATGTTTLPVPTARDVRVRLYPRCTAKANYYGADSPPAGLSSDYIVRKAAVAEDRLFPDEPASELRAFYFQPGSNVAQLLAQGLGLAQDGLTLSGAPGIRTVFGASGALKHALSPDGSTLTLANQAELLGHWIIAIVLDIERDWTWDGFAQGGSPPPLNFSRSGAPTGAVAPGPIGAIVPARVVAPPTASPPAGAEPNRSLTRIVFLDALDPHPAPGAFAAELHPVYSVDATFEAGGAEHATFEITLPVTTPPVQTPRIAATGIAESPFVRSDDYSRTEQRERVLWIEFEEPIVDPDDAYFARVLAYGPDPLLSTSLAPRPKPEQMAPQAPEPALAIDPEPVRAIFAGQSSDDSGLDAMTPLVPADASSTGPADRLFMLPLPPGIDAEDLKLFGFWTYEFRVGHANKPPVKPPDKQPHSRWSTAQGRFGRPLRVTGIQHPTPHLACAVHRTPEVIEVTAPYATTVSAAGERLYDIWRGDPQTEIWFMLYAQVRQADGLAYRNILLTHGLGTLELRGIDESRAGQLQSPGRDPRARIVWEESMIRHALSMLGLAVTSPLSTLAVELLPGQGRIVSSQLLDRIEAGGADFSAAEVLAAEQLALEQADAEAVATATKEDPLGSNLGKRRILRVSPLTSLPAVC